MQFKYNINTIQIQCENNTNTKNENQKEIQCTDNKGTSILFCSGFPLPSAGVPSSVAGNLEIWK